MNSVFTFLAILIWIAIGAIVGMFATMLVMNSKEAHDDCSLYGDRLGKPCWINVNGDYEKFRVVAVSHKGSIAVRDWNDDSGKHAKWIRHGEIEKGDYVYFDEKDI